MDTYRPLRTAERHVIPIAGHSASVSVWPAPGKPTLLALHGWGDCGASFQFLADALTDDFTVVAPDWRGFGESASDETSFYFPNYLADLEAIVAHFFATGPANIVAHSMGGNVAGLFAGVRADRVARLINIEGFGLTDSDPAAAPQRYRAWLDSLAVTPSQRDYATTAELAERVMRRAPQLEPGRALFVAEQWSQRDAATGRWRLRATPAHKRPNPVLYRREEARACWRATTAGVLLVHSAAGGATWDGMAGAAADYAAALGERCCGVEVLPDCGHNLHMERPAALADLVRRYWATLGAA